MSSSLATKEFQRVIATCPLLCGRFGYCGLGISIEDSDNSHITFVHRVLCGYKLFYLKLNINSISRKLAARYTINRGN